MATVELLAFGHRTHIVDSKSPRLQVQCEDCGYCSPTTVDVLDVHIWDANHRIRTTKWVVSLITGPG